MESFANRAARFWSELRRRKTFGTAIAYLIVLAAVVGPVSDILDGLGAPEWILQGIIIALLLGFPVVLILSWVFDFTLHGIERTEDLADEPEADEIVLPEPETSHNKPSVEIETGTAHRYQVTLLRTSIVLARDGVVVEDPESLLPLIPQIQQAIEALAEKYNAVATFNSSTSCEFIFGYPKAYENDAIRAVVMALAIAQDLRHLGNSLLKGQARELTALSGVKSDLVVIDSSSEAMSVIGSASQDTLSLQSLAAAGDVIIDDFTHQLLRNRVLCESAGTHQNAQSGATSQVYKALELHQSELNPASADDRGGLFLGRSTELALMADRWERALDGEEEFIILRGEPGMGKSALVREFTRHAATTDTVQVMPLYCSPLERNTAFQPITEFLMGQGLGLSESKSTAERTERITQVMRDLEIDVEKAVPLVASLISFEAGSSGSLSESARRELMQYLVDFLRASARDKALLFIVEDLHWADASTLEILSLLVSEKSESGMLCLFTARPSLKLEWEARSNVTTLNLQKLSKRSTSELVSGILQELAPAESFIRRIVDEAGGNPLFAEELAIATLEAAQANPDHKLSELVLPINLQRSIAARVDNLGSAKPLLQLCSLLGREFDYELLKSVSNTADEATLEKDLRMLVNGEFLYQRGAMPNCQYTFKHALVRESAYQSMLQSTRQQLHERVLAVLEQNAGDIPNELLAYHYEGSHQFDKAVARLTAAAQTALTRYAMREAIGLTESGLRVVVKIPASQSRDIAEIGLQAIRGRALLTSYGYAEPEVQRTFQRALELSDGIEDLPQLFTLLCGLWSYFQIGGSVVDAGKVADRMMQLAEAEDSCAQRFQAHYCMGYSRQRAGELQSALEHMDKAQEIAATNEADYSQFSPSGDDGRIHQLSVSAHIHWHLGDTDQAMKLKQQAIDLAIELEHPVGITFAQFLGTWLMQLAQDYQGAIELGTRTIELARKMELNFWIHASEFIVAWARWHRQAGTDGTGPDNEVAQMLLNLERFRQSGASFGAPGMCADSAEVLARNSRLDEARAILKTSNDLIETTGEGYVASCALRAAAALARAEGNNDLAIEQLQSARESALQTRHLGYWAHASTNLVSLYRHLGREQEAAAIEQEMADS